MGTQMFFSLTMWILKQYISSEGGWSPVLDTRTMCYVCYRHSNEIVSEIASSWQLPCKHAHERAY